MDKEIKNVVLALVAGRDKIGKAEILLIDDMDLENGGQIIKVSSEHTLVRSMVKLLADVIRLDFYCLAKSRAP